MEPTVMPRLIATDLDGTLLRSDLSISPFTRRVLRGLEDRAIHVVFVTARPPRWMAPLAEAAGGHGRAICINGACVYEFATGQSSHVFGFTHDQVAALVTDLRTVLPGIAFASERPSGAVFDPSFVSSHPVGPETLIQPVETAHDDVVGKLLARMPGMPDSQFFDIVDEVVAERALLAYSGASGLAEMTAPGVTKAAALERFALSHGIEAREVWAFGDMPNDIPMLRWAGRGIAVGNAHPEVLNAADAITGSNDDDGLAHEIVRGLGPLLDL
jgi:hydroxymethylpyrimidine pyrophosphatase-like HAD family hydrolase